MAPTDQNDPRKKPLHVAMIMDGNGRWAKARSLPRLAGHQRGAKVLHEIVEACLTHGVNVLTVYAFSSENWGRADTEVKGLFKLIEAYLDREERLLLEQDICLRVIGERDRLPRPLQERIDRIERLTATKQGLVLQVALSYGSRSEIARAARSVARDVLAGKMNVEDITEKAFAAHLDTAGLPDPDLLIRTGGEERLSNYLLWQLAYTEFIFLEKYWPDFTTQDFAHALDQYALRERRYGLAP